MNFRVRPQMGGQIMRFQRHPRDGQSASRVASQMRTGNTHRHNPDFSLRDWKGGALGPPLHGHQGYFKSHPLEQLGRAYRAEFRTAATRRRFPSPQLVAVNLEALTSQRLKKRRRVAALQSSLRMPVVRNSGQCHPSRPEASFETTRDFQTTVLWPTVSTVAARKR